MDTQDDVEVLKSRLQTYEREDLLFNEPHFTFQLQLRQGNREEVIHHLLHPTALVYSYAELGRYGDLKHMLHFALDSTKTLRIPVIFDPSGKKGLYILTYILRYRPWYHMVKRED